MNRQHNNHLIEWFKAKFNLTIEYLGYDGFEHYFQCWKGDYDLDIKHASGYSIYGAALEYTACYDGELNDKLVQLEMGEPELFIITRICVSWLNIGTKLKHLNLKQEIIN